MKHIFLLNLFFSALSFSQYTSIEEIKEKKDTIESLDLSFKQLKEIPDLSNYIIKDVNLSSNYIDSLNFRYLPKGLEKLNLSDNYLKGNIFLLKRYDNKDKLILLKKINLSHNKIKHLSIDLSNFKEINISFNDLHSIGASYNQNLSFLDISNNKNLNPTSLGIDFRKIKTIIRNNLKTDQPLGSFLLTEDIPQKGKILQ